MSEAAFYRFLKGAVRRACPRYTLCGTENLPEGAYVIVGNHAQIQGPVVSQLYLPGKNYTWCAGEMFSRKEVPAYARKDFWSEKPKWTKPFFYAASYAIAPLSVYVFGHADAIPVYHDARIMSTLKMTTQKLAEGNHVVIFPEGHNPHNHIVAEFQPGYTSVSKLYTGKTGQELAFVPMYVAPSLGKISFGKPEYSCKEESREEGQKRISEALMRKITELAQKLPLHRVTPYENIAKKDYPMNRP